MVEIRPSYYNNKRYTLRGLIGNLEISEPINWNEDEKEFKRSEDVHGVFTNLSNNLQFYKGDENNNGGYDYLKQTYDVYGINASVLLVKDEKIDGEWSESYRGYLDYSTYSRESNKIEIKFNESGLYEKIKARQSEDLEINRTTTMDGTDLTNNPLTLNTVYYSGRDILLSNELIQRKSERYLSIPSGDNSVILSYVNDKTALVFAHSLGGNYEAIALPLAMSNEISGNVQTVYDYNIKEDGNSYENANDVSTMFYANATQDKKLTIDFDINLALNVEKSTTIRLDLVKYKNGLVLDFDEYINLAKVENFIGSNSLIYKDTKQIDLYAGESLALAVHSAVSSIGFVVAIVNKCNVIIQDPTYFEATEGSFILPHELLDRILYIITNEKNTLKSNDLGRIDLNYKKDGDSAFTGLTSGFWIRGFGDSDSDGFKDLTTSFKDFMESFKTTRQLGYGIEKIGFDEKVVVEKIPYFYQSEVTIKIGKPSRIKRTVASDYFYSSIDIGYEKPSGDSLYDEAMGLDEYNVSSTYTTNISRVSNVLELKSKYRADSYGMEFARRKQKYLYPKEDTKYDQDVFLLDLEKSDDGGENFIQRKWEKDFVKPINFSIFATGVYSAETATNLRLSPLNLLLRWGFWIKCGLEKYKDTYIRYSSSEGNSKLTTQLLDSEHEYSENGNILVDNLDKSLFIPEYIEFEYPIDAKLLKTINSKSVNVDGDEIMNYYGLVEFTNEDGLLEYGFLMELKPNGNGEWKLLKANKKAVRKAIFEAPLSRPEATLEGGFDYDLNTEIDG